MKDKQPLVSIALASYNGEHFIAQQIESLLSQTYSNLEIIISDDGSNDKTIDIIETFIAKGFPIKLFKNELEKGVNKNFENAIRNCNGEFIALCDQDDIWRPQKIERLVTNIGSSALIYHNSLFVDIEGNSLNRTIGEKMNCYTGNDPKVFLVLNCVSGHETMFVKSLVDIAIPFPTVKYFDWWLAFIATQNGGVKYLDEVLVHYRQHEKTVTDMLAMKKSTMHKKEFIIYEEELEWYVKCSEVAVQSKPFFEKWAKLYKARKNQWFSFSLFLLARKNATALYTIKKKGKLSIFFESLKLLWGLKTKRKIG